MKNYAFKVYKLFVDNIIPKFYIYSNAMYVLKKEIINTAIKIINFPVDR